MNESSTAIPHPPELQEYTCDILVLGGGLPGVCAAIAAAQGGLDVILVERSLTLGGNCGPEIGVHPSDAHRFHPYMISTGIVGRLIEDAAYYHAKTDSQDRHYNISMQWDMVMQTALDEAGVRVLRSHYAHTPYMDGSRIAAVECEDTLTYRRVRISVKNYVIDDTGDGNISERAGARFRMGREAAREFGERLAPEEADTITMGSSLVTLIRNTGAESPFFPGKDTPPFYPGYGGDMHFIPEPGSSLYFMFPTETGGDLDTIQDGHQIYRRLRRHLDSCWDKCKNGYECDAVKNWEMVWVSSKIGKRETRRFLGDYTVTETDVETGRMFDDAIAVGGFAIDVHDPKKEQPEYVNVTYYLIPPVYTIPYRSIYSADIDNLFFASRLLSATHLAHGTIRLQRTLACVGQAAGTAAVLCARYGITPRELYTQGHVEQLQQILLREDCTIPNRVNQDPADLVRQATVRASSERSYGVSREGRFVPIQGVAGVELWDFSERLDRWEVLLKNPTDKPVTVAAELSRFVQERPWQYRWERPFLPYYATHNEVEWGGENRVRFYRSLAGAEVTLPPRFEGYAAFDFQARLTPKNPLSDDDRLALVLKPQDGDLQICVCDGLYSFVRLLSGIETTPEGEEAYRVGPGSCLYRLTPTPPCAEAALILNGHNRRFSENPGNMWRPAALPADIQLSWQTPITARQIRITFDTLERAFVDMPYENGRRVSGQCVKRYSLGLYLGEQEVFRCSQDDNYHRLTVTDLPAVVCDRLVLTLQEVWDSTRIPGVYEIRVY